eukprot:TRINITY_DN40915_c0_g1_i1.p1 TRINITY_DN40915_c0_g1~~TRINITY_DN40915_c0_g1_i1.p1  ORF type:complete len:510 (+),score=64.58 TRINITY_DN40915_c0_g1_i1:67-1596(+)
MEAVRPLYARALTPGVLSQVFNFCIEKRLSNELEAILVACSELRRIMVSLPELQLMSLIPPDQHVLGMLKTKTFQRHLAQSQYPDGMKPHWKADVLCYESNSAGANGDCMSSQRIVMTMGLKESSECRLGIIFGDVSSYSNRYGERAVDTCVQVWLEGTGWQEFARNLAMAEHSSHSRSELKPVFVAERNFYAEEAAALDRQWFGKLRTILSLPEVEVCDHWVCKPPSDAWSAMRWLSWAVTGSPEALWEWYEEERDVNHEGDLFSSSLEFSLDNFLASRAQSRGLTRLNLPDARSLLEQVHNPDALVTELTCTMCERKQKERNANFLAICNALGITTSDVPEFRLVDWSTYSDSSRHDYCSVYDARGVFAFTSGVQIEASVFTDCRYSEDNTQTNVRCLASNASAAEFLAVEEFQWRPVFRYHRREKRMYPLLNKLGVLLRMDAQHVLLYLIAWLVHNSTSGSPKDVAEVVRNYMGMEEEDGDEDDSESGEQESDAGSVDACEPEQED